MITCVVGAGAREHALAQSLARSSDVIVTPGNAGIAGRSREGFSMRSTLAPAREVEADLYVIGPEVPLVAGLADELRAAGKAVFGPSAAAARLEGSKSHMKQLAERAFVPTARFAVCSTFEDAKAAFRRFGGPYVVKTDGLAAGKGVLVTESLAEAEQDAAEKLSGARFGDAGRTIVVEEALFGEELSLLVLTDGTTAEPLPVARDYKRLHDGDRGPNTGGMGAFSPVPEVSPSVVGEIMSTIVEPSLAMLQKDGVTYRGILYAGCMLTADGPKLIEFNVRLGDPEAEVVLPRVVSDFAEIAHEVATGSLSGDVKIDPRAAVCVVLAADQYPLDPSLGDVITGVDEAGTVGDVMIFHGGTARASDGSLRTAGGRVLTVSALSETLEQARRSVYERVGAITFDGMQYRRDIAAGVSAMGKDGDR